MTNRKILIVDDDSELREALVEQLALHEEFEPIAVDNGTKGVQTAKDVGLPDVDGREAVRILRKNGFKAWVVCVRSWGEFVQGSWVGRPAIASSCPDPLMT